MQNRPSNFQIAESAKARILSAVQGFDRTYPLTPWIAGIVWAIHASPDHTVVREGPSVVPYDRRDVPADTICNINGVAVIFMSADTRFDNKTLHFSAGRDFYLE